MLENWISRMAVSPIFVLGVHLSLGLRQVHSYFRYDFGVRQRECLVFRYESGECRYESGGEVWPL